MRKSRSPTFKKVGFDVSPSSSLKASERFPGYSLESKFATGKFVTESVAVVLLSCEDVEAARNCLSNDTQLLHSISHLNLDDERSELILDFHMINLRFCIDGKFDAKQVSTFLGMMNNLLLQTIQKRPDISQALAIFKDQVLMHSVEFPPMSVGIFSVDDTRLLCEFALNTFFRYFTMYRYAFVSHLELKVTTANDSLNPN